MCPDQLIVFIVQSIIIPLLLTVLGIVIALWYANLGKPKLITEHSFKDTIKGPISGHDRRSLRIRIKNVPRKFPWVNRKFPWVDYKTAISCHGNIIFLDQNKKPISNSKPMQIRWADSPEPIKKLIDNNGKIVFLPEPNLIRLSRYIDIQPDESEPCDLAIRFDKEDAAYGCCTDSYFNDWRHPDYKLDQGAFFAKVTILTGALKFEFPPIPFSNPVNFENFEIG